MRITPERSRQIFGNPSPPETITEQQFDGFDDKLAKVGTTDWHQIAFADLWYYLHDLAYRPLQPDLFAYLFPVCLNFWYHTLMHNREAGLGDAEFHYSLYQGQVLEKMLTAEQRQAVYDYFHDAMLDRIEAERGFVYNHSKTPFYTIVARFNALGFVAPVTGRIWESWWRLDHPGKAVAAVMYASGLIYDTEENPIFEPWTPDKGGGGPYLDSSEAQIYGGSWLEANLEFMLDKLAVETIQSKMQEAASVLQNEPEAVVAAQVAADAAERTELIEIRIDDLLEALTSLGAN